MFVHHSYKGRETLWFLEQPLRKELTQKGKSCFSGSKTFSFSGQARQGHFDSCFLWTCIYTPPLETDLRCVIIPNMGIAKKLFLDYPNFWLISMGCNFADPNQSTTDLNLCCLIKIYWKKNRNNIVLMSMQRLGLVSTSCEWWIPIFSVFTTSASSIASILSIDWQKRPGPNYQWVSIWKQRYFIEK